MGKEGKEVEFFAEEEDTSSVVEEISEASGIGLDRLDLGVEALCYGISDRKAHKVQEALEVALEHLGDRLDFMQPATDRPSIPFLKNAFYLPRGPAASPAPGSGCGGARPRGVRCDKGGSRPPR